MRIYFWALLVFPFVAFGIIFTVLYKPPLDLLDPEAFTSAEFSDKNDGGNSQSSITKTESSILVNCVLEDGYQYPYSGIQFFNSSASLFDLSNYAVSIQLTVSYDVRLSIRLNQFIDNYTDTANDLSYLVLAKSFGLKKGKNVIELNISDINEIKDWWFQLNPRMINKIDKISYTNTKVIWLYIENSTPLHKPLQIEIEAFTFHYAYMPLIYNFSIGAFLYYIILIIIVWKIKKVKYILMPIELSNIGNRIPETQNQILAYIGKNYSNSELKISHIAHEVAISQDHVAELIRKHSGLTFRQYLNQVRLEEAKHLLRNSEYQIAEIAYKIGYNSVQHFNRMFKEYTSFTPTSFRNLK